MSSTDPKALDEKTTECGVLETIVRSSGFTVLATHGVVVEKVAGMKTEAVSEIAVYLMMLVGLLLCMVVFFGGAIMFSLNGGEMTLVVLGLAAIGRVLLSRWRPLSVDRRRHLLRIATTSATIFLVLQFLK